MSADRLEVSVTFDAAKGYVASCRTLCTSCCSLTFASARSATSGGAVVTAGRVDYGAR
jgi:hypothetical protein